MRKSVIVLANGVVWRGEARLGPAWWGKVWSGWAGKSGWGGNMIIQLDVPVPPSVNRLWRAKNAKGRTLVYRDPKHDRWLRTFWFCWLRDKPKDFKIIESEFEATILVCPKFKRDADNSAKALMDAAQSVGIIKNDSQARKVTQELVGRDQAPLGCRLTIKPL